MYVKCICSNDVTEMLTMSQSCTLPDLKKKLISHINLGCNGTIGNLFCRCDGEHFLKINKAIIITLILIKNKSVIIDKKLSP